AVVTPELARRMTDLLLILEECEARVPGLREPVGVESSVRIEEAASEVLAYQPEQGHRAGGVGDAERGRHLGGVGLADVREVGEQLLLRHARGPPQTQRLEASAARR